MHAHDEIQTKNFQCTLGFTHRLFSTVAKFEYTHSRIVNIDAGETKIISENKYIHFGDGIVQDLDKLDELKEINFYSNMIITKDLVTIKFNSDKFSFDFKCNEDYLQTTIEELKSVCEKCDQSKEYEFKNA